MQLKAARRGRLDISIKKTVIEVDNDVNFKEEKHGV